MLWRHRFRGTCIMMNLFEIFLLVAPRRAGENCSDHDATSSFQSFCQAASFHHQRWWNIWTRICGGEKTRPRGKIIIGHLPSKLFQIKFQIPGVSQQDSGSPPGPVREMSPHVPHRAQSGQSNLCPGQSYLKILWLFHCNIWCMQNRNRKHLWWAQSVSSMLNSLLLRIERRALSRQLNMLMSLLQNSVSRIY